ncbi:hypothetical protein VTN31DRAFT_297 [Thermomyces dupontii]|uniref:uncharacterized protein n=1 Tax=Talaromyces thermophilus TaxID=28565 RepID=UPI003743F342
MATNGTSAGRASGSGLVEASGYKFSERDLKPGKIKIVRKEATNGVKTDDNNDIDAPGSPDDSPVLPQLDEKTMAAFPSGNPREEELETVVCKHCKRPVLKQTAAEHIRGCLRAKQEKARKKKEARDAKNQAKEKLVDGDDDDKEGEDGGQKSAKKSAVADGDGPKKSKKRKAGEGEDDKDSKEPKKKKKKDEPKPKVPKPKGPVDVEKQCGVMLPNGTQCARSLTCKSHSMGAKRAVPGRSLPYDMLLQAYQKKNQARQQKAAIDANAPLQDDLEPTGPVDSDEERDAVMAAISRSRPQPLVTHTLMPTRKKYQYVRMKEMLSNVLGGPRGGGLFSTGEPDGTADHPLLQMESPTVPASTLPDASGDAAKRGGVSNANRSTGTPTTVKAAVAATS